MALKFLNKKGWHTGSLRNIENVWKAEQKHDAEQKKLEELRKQIHEEREKAEFRQLQEQAGLVPRQERLDFLYESGLAVGKSSEGFKSLETPAAAATASASAEAEAGSSKAVVPGALFEDKPQSANDTWRKLHSDPLLLIRQREQEALARIKNNPVQMSMIRKSVEAEKKNKKDKGQREKKKHKRKHNHNSKNNKNLDSEDTSESENDGRKRNRSALQEDRKSIHSSKYFSEDEERTKINRSKGKTGPDLQDSSKSEDDRKKSGHSTSEHRRHRNESRLAERYEEIRNKHVPSGRDDEHRNRHEPSERDEERRNKHVPSENEERRKKHVPSENEERRKNVHSERDEERRNKHAPSENEERRNKHVPTERDEERTKHVPSERDEERRTERVPSSFENKETRETRPQNLQGPGYNRRKGVPKMTEEEREARLREMQMDAEVHEEQRWKRIKRAADDDAREAARARFSSGGKNFLDDAQKSIFGTEKGGSSTIEESVRRRAYYSQGGTAAHESNAFRR